MKTRQIGLLLMCRVNELKELYKIFVNAKIVKLLEWIEVGLFVFFSQVIFMFAKVLVKIMFNWPQMSREIWHFFIKSRHPFPAVHVGYHSVHVGYHLFLKITKNWPVPLTSLNFSFLWNDSSFIGAIFATFFLIWNVQRLLHLCWWRMLETIFWCRWPIFT